MINQNTVAQNICFQGRGLHTGQDVHLCIKPAPENTGIVFRRMDAGIDISAAADNIIDDFLRRTTISSGGVNVNTIEHLMVVFSVLGIDNAIVEIDAEEVPGMDGSAKIFYEKIRAAGTVPQDMNRIYKIIKSPFYVCRGDSVAVILPYDGFKISYTLDYPQPEIGSGFYEVDMADTEKIEQLVCARTFCLESEALKLRGMGLGKGADYTNTLVVGHDGPIDNDFRFKYELAAHKTVDMIGDLYIAGPVKGHVVALRCGHGINAQIVKLLAKERI